MVNATPRANTLFRLLLKEEKAVCRRVCVFASLFVHTQPSFIGSIEASSPYSLYAITSEPCAECLYMIVFRNDSLWCVCSCVCSNSWSICELVWLYANICASLMEVCVWAAACVRTKLFMINAGARVICDDKICICGFRVHYTSIINM